ncbi:sodium-dependent transporter [Sedimentisphaera salicampi]|uniref:sodium-dependent transporter n=1 Tax=Sedimentisphaera salicampi TaxID=1941349 RepID=UPI000B9AC764|nr:sodium-dependent transporter [Sedimentisphaera salicampi]OXU14810.1 Na+-dependent transporters of the SNF family protein [Sedimentisphaera salicampi]
MTDLLEKRENWGSLGGFILAAVGSAVGLGNLWAFPYKIYSFGGGAFLIPYIIALFAVGLPLIILEFSLGHYTQRAAPNAMRRCVKPFEGIGWLGSFMCILIICYYPVILGYCLTYLGYSIQGIFNGGELPWAAEGVEGINQAKGFFFDKYLNHHESFSLGGVELKVLGPVIIIWILMYLCIFKGINLVGKIVWLTVPIPWIMLIILTVRGLTLDGSTEGLAYYLSPDFSELAKPITWRYAFGQVFFSMSLGWGTMIAYSSFLHRKSDLNNNAGIITLTDFATSFIAGVAIFATLGGMSYVTAQAGNAVPVDQVADKGVSLAFIAFPYTLAQLPFSAWFSFFFFLALVTLGIDSAFSITETLLASIVDKTGFSRGKVLVGITVAGIFVSSVFATQGGLNWVGEIDGIVNGTFGAAFLGLLECLAIGWLYRLDYLRKHSNSCSEWPLGKWWDVSIRIVIPIILGTLFFWNIFDKATAGTPMKNPEGGYNINVLVTAAVTALGFLLAGLATLLKTRIQDDVPNIPHLKINDMPNRKKIRRHFSSACVIFALSIAAFGLTIHNTAYPDSVILEQKLVMFLAYLLIVSAAVDAFQAEKNISCLGQLRKLPNIQAGASGVMSVMSISACLSIILTYLSDILLEDKAKAEIPDSLTTVSYIILAFVTVVVVGGLIWSFHRIKASKNNELQETEAI